jgi:hypothetical protein
MLEAGCRIACAQFSAQAARRSMTLNNRCAYFSKDGKVNPVFFPRLGKVRRNQSASFMSSAPVALKRHGLLVAVGPKTCKYKFDAFEQIPVIAACQVVIP